MVLLVDVLGEPPKVLLTLKKSFPGVSQNMI